MNSTPIEHRAADRLKAFEAYGNRRKLFPSSIQAVLEAEKQEAGILQQLKEKEFHD